MESFLEDSTPLAFRFKLGSPDSPLAPDETQPACSFRRSSTCENPENTTLLDCPPFGYKCPVVNWGFEYWAMGTADTRWFYSSY